ncbi:MAG: acyl carrier protein [bacterium]|jgi:acyl carrier protein
MSKNNEKLMDLISRVLSVEIKTITDEMSPQNTDSWDSFNGLLMASELEEVFSVNFSIDEVYAITCVKDIKKALVHHNVSFE